MAIDRIGTNGLVASAIVPPDGSISTAKIADDAITSAKIGVDVIAAEDLANNSVTVAELSNGAVTTAKIAANAVDHTKVGAGLVCGFTYVRLINTENTISTTRTLIVGESSSGSVYTPKYSNSILKIQFAYAYHSNQTGSGTNVYTEFWRSADGGNNWMNLLGDQSITATTAQLATNMSQPRLRQHGYATAAAYSNVELIDTTYNTTNELKFRMYAHESSGENALVFDQAADPHPGGYFMVTEIAQ